MVSTKKVSTEASVQDLLEAGLHFGHQTKRWNPKMKRFIFAERNGIYIIDLNKTLEQLSEAQQFLYDTVARGRKVLFVGTKKQAQDPLRDAAKKLGMPYIVHRWLGGMLTNSTTVRKSVSRMRDLGVAEEDNSIDAKGKKEGAKRRRELNKLRRNLIGVADMDSPPGALFIVDVNRESIAVKEARRLNIPIVALVDTNSNPDDIDYPIPGNDDAIRAIQLIITELGDTILDASNEYAKFAAEEIRRKAAEEQERKAREEKERKIRDAAVEKAKAEAAIKAKIALEKKKLAETEAAKAAPAKAEKPAEAPKAAPKTEEAAPKKAEAPKTAPEEKAADTPPEKPATDEKTELAENKEG